MKNFGPILIAEDNDMDLELALEALSTLNLSNKIEVVRDGEEALDYLYSRGKYANKDNPIPVVILLDIKMPKVDGLEVLKAIQSDVDFRQIPVVMLTSSKEEKDIARCYELGVNAFVVKPVDFDQFNQVIREIGLFWGVSNQVPIR
ncbi:MAG: response regulator [Flavobacteriales bacterium]|nr:response regulator [Flavobacteriales bacterium]